MFQTSEKSVEHNPVMVHNSRSCMNKDLTVGVLTCGVTPQIYGLAIADTHIITSVQEVGKTAPCELMNNPVNGEVD